VENWAARILDTRLKTPGRPDPILNATLIDLCRAATDWPAA
jgi:hypothetical protein